MEKNSWTDRVRDGGAVHTVKEERNILHTIKEGTVNGLITLCLGTAL